MAPPIQGEVELAGSDAADGKTGRGTTGRRTMKCPRCQGHDVRTIAPGYYECQSVVTTTYFVPDQTRSGQMRPASAGAICNHLWQEGSSSLNRAAPVCHECGTFAVGRCPSCGLAVCGLHSWLMNERRLCRTDALAAKKVIDDWKAVIAQYRQDRLAAVHAAAKRREQHAVAEMRRLVHELNKANQPSIARRQCQTYEDRLFSKKRRSVVKSLEPGWPVGPLLWYWDYQVYGDNISGEVALPGAILPNGDIVELNVGFHSVSRGGRLKHRPHILQTERINESLACHLAGRALPQRREGSGTEDGAGLYVARIKRLEVVCEAVDQTFSRALEGSVGIDELTAAAVELDEAFAEVDDLMNVVEAEWLAGVGGDRILKAQEMARFTRAQIEKKISELDGGVTDVSASAKH